MLNCLSLIEPEVGYVQGMGYMCAILLIYMDKEDAFSIMLNLLNNKPYQIKDYYARDMIGLKLSFYILLSLIEKKLPKLHKHFLNEMVTPPHYATHWFMTLFSTKMPLELTLRIWDIFFIEGIKILYRVGLAILKLNEKVLLKSDFEGITTCLRTFLEES